MVKIQQRIKERRTFLNKTLLEVANYIGIKEATVQRYESGEIKTIPYDRIVSLSECLQCTPQYLMGWTDELYHENTKNTVSIPVFSNIIINSTIKTKNNIIGYEDVSKELVNNDECFGLKIQGDSMNPLFLENDTIIVKKQNQIENGEIAVIAINDDLVTVKKIKTFKGGMHLVPINPNYDVITFSNKEIETLPIRILGKVIELRRKF